MNKIMIVIGIMVAVAAFGIVFANNKIETNSIYYQQNGTTEQTINLALGSNGQYIPNEIRVKVGTKITLIGDTNTMRGCMQTVIINGYGVKKTMLPGDNVVEFVADKPGTFSITCPMGMGVGRFVVEDQAGYAPPLQQEQVPEYTCGGGGCGCGG